MDWSDIQRLLVESAQEGLQLDFKSTEALGSQNNQRSGTR